mmetsp:Transcript_27677/g.78261  ORF Transcript_27677/g.78261 Transcript_27677/m.78261 type:complete len:207 (-) Transcript_27677:183-803(-)|eukprot:CAMPEP_0117677330 /NCGR_PEP_ID=MMETSP0804-20121206/16688_1 /TAXON_ID=1074897 /ORGANISM="Tetraselmis astigmatica, Strain CCMP880" /LENGTH=206 /DNA_ID=CAMNT_0005486607 /DNA_START=94 /DNA_END=714 /DNA_ORIENTATION=+
MASGGFCSHDHDCEAQDCAPQWVLYKHVDMLQVSCLNEAVRGSCRNVLKPWHQRAEPTETPLRSNADDAELLLHIPFTGDVKLSSICVVGAGDALGPSRMRAFINRNDLDFGTVENATAAQEWDLLENPQGHIEYPTKVTKFINVHSLTLHFPDSFGGDVTEIHFVGLKGEYKEARREAVHTVYESKPMPEDHKVPGEQGANHFIN